MSADDGADWRLNGAEQLLLVNLVNGESGSYGYARQHYEDFIFGGTPAEWYGRFKDRVGFIITRNRAGPGLRNNQTRLHDNYRSAGSTLTSSPP